MEYINVKNYHLQNINICKLQQQNWCSDVLFSTIIKFFLLSFRLVHSTSLGWLKTFSQQNSMIYPWNKTYLLCIICLISASPCPYNIEFATIFLQYCCNFCWSGFKDLNSSLVFLPKQNSNCTHVYIFFIRF